MYRTDDPIADFNRWDAEMAEKELRLPVCECCCEPIQDDIFFDVEGDILCESCMMDNYRRYTDDYVEANK